ncbi:MAG: TetR/AcrR family transcriptional regulator [Anaerolineales bacterium]|jgi:AcrR family transcriptional regulator
MSPRPDVSEKRKNQILDAAMSVFARLGFNHARMDDIAQEAGLSKGSLYWYFESKDDIIINILDNLIGREIDLMKEAIDSYLPAKERLLSFTEIVIADLERMKPLMPILFEFWSLLARRKIVQKTINRYYHSYMDAIIPIIEQGIKTGEFRSVDSQKAGIALGTIFEGTILLWAYAPEMVSLGENIDYSVRLLIEGLENNAKE